MRYIIGSEKNRKGKTVIYTVFSYHGCSSEDDVRVFEFETLEDLFHYVRTFDYIDKHGRQRNRFLDATICNASEAQKPGRELVYCNEQIFHRSTTYYDGYLTQDNNGKVIDLRYYTNELYAFDDKSYRAAKYAKRRAEREARSAARDAMREKADRLTEGKDYWRCYRRIKTTQERRYAADPGHKPFVRSRRSFANLPNSWDELYFPREKSWKARDRKARCQWDTKIVKHIGTANLPRPWDDLLEELELLAEEDIA